MGTPSTPQSAPEGCRPDPGTPVPPVGGSPHPCRTLIHPPEITAVTIPWRGQKIILRPLLPLRLTDICSPARCNTDLVFHLQHGAGGQIAVCYTLFLLARITGPAQGTTGKATGMEVGCATASAR